MINKLPNRTSLRMQGFDYAQNYAYFVTLSTFQRHHLFGQVFDEQMKLSQMGEIVQRHWLNLQEHFPLCTTDMYVVMPDHSHGILCLRNPIRTGHRPVPTMRQTSLSDVIRGFKTFSAIEVNRLRGVKGQPVWQPRFYDHVIRDERDYERICEYIIDNPLRWELEKNQKVGWLM